jgi:hypothetical protein
MTLHFIPHQKSEYHGLSKPQAQNGDSVEKVDGHRYPSGSFLPPRKEWSPLCQVPLGDEDTSTKSEAWCVAFFNEEVVLLSLLKVVMNLLLEGLDLFNQSSCMIYLSVGGIYQ